MKIEQKTTTIEIIARLDKEGKEVNSGICARMYYELTGEHVDWHEFAYYLDELYSKGFLKITSPGGRVGYRISQ